VACPGAKPEDYLDPNMWSLVDTFYPFDLARIVAADGSWWGLYLMAAVADRKVLAVRLLMALDLDKPDAPINDGLPQGYRIRRGQPIDGQEWISFRVADGLVLNPGMPHHSYKECRDHLLSLAIFRVDGPTEYTV
jgi:hypothetical protein